MRKHLGRGWAGYDGASPMTRLACAAIALAACTGEGKQIVIELDGDVTATNVELVFVDPHVSIKRNQRINEVPLDPRTEPTFYVVQRSRLDLVVGQTAQPVDGLELQVVGAEGLLPVAIARAEQGQIVGMGVLDPPAVFFDRGDNADNFATRLEEIADVTRYTIEVEPVGELPSLDASDAPVSIGSGHIRQVQCRFENDTPAISGLVWRAEAGPQLRIALPIDGSDDALFRVEGTGYDLDCDMHTPAERGIAKGDEKDCDDTSRLVNGESPLREQCDAVDNDCDPSTMGAIVMADGCASCSGRQLTCYEEIGGMAQIEGGGCTDVSKCVFCKLHTELDPNGVGTFGCNNIGVLAAPPGCDDQCVMRVVSDDPNWDIKLGDVDDPGSLVHGKSQGFTPTTGKFGFAAIPKQPTTALPTSSLGGFLIAFQTTPGSPVSLMDVVFFSDPSTTHDVCASPEQVPACGPDG